LFSFIEYAKVHFRHFSLSEGFLGYPLFSQEMTSFSLFRDFRVNRKALLL
jgi:hypothetical protein